MINHHGGVVLAGDFIYGYSDGPGWTCQHLTTGEAVWRHRVTEPGRGNPSAGGCLHASTRGSRSLTGSLPSQGWKESGRLEIPERSQVPSQDKELHLPVIAGGNLYLRDHDLLFCFELKK